MNACVCQQPDCATCWWPWVAERHLSTRSSEDLLRFINGAERNGLMNYSPHMLCRVEAFVFLHARLGLHTERLPYQCWHLVFGDVPPPKQWGAGMFKDAPEVPMLHDVARATKQ
jgi:hypothetical protein